MPRPKFPVGDKTRRQFNSAATKQLNSEPWLLEWMREKIPALAKTVGQNVDDKHKRGGTHFFYIKGGRALPTLLADAPPPEQQDLREELERLLADVTSDWDSQIVINPNLRPDTWYATY